MCDHTSVSPAPRPRSRARITPSSPRCSIPGTTNSQRHDSSFLVVHWAKWNHTQHALFVSGFFPSIISLMKTPPVLFSVPPSTGTGLAPSSSLRTGAALNIPVSSSGASQGRGAGSRGTSPRRRCWGFQGDRTFYASADIRESPTVPQPHRTYSFLCFLF